MNEEPIKASPFWAVAIFFGNLCILPLIAVAWLFDAILKLVFGEDNVG